MPVYRAKIEGSDFLFEEEGRAPESKGFYVVHWVTATSEREAAKLAIECVHSSPKVRGQAALRLEVVELEEAPPEHEGRSPTGFLFFPSGSEPN